MAHEYFWECHALCFSENRKGISEIYPKIEDFVQFIIIWLNWERIWENGPIGNVFTNSIAEKLPFQMLQTILKYS